LWYNIVGSEDPRHKVAGVRVEALRQGRKATISYASKYAAKMAQKDVPENIRNCGRFWGVSGLKTVVVADTFISQERNEELAQQVKALERCVRTALANPATRVIKKERGLLVAILTKNSEISAIMTRIQLIEARIASYSSIFADAELDIDMEP